MAWRSRWLICYAQTRRLDCLAYMRPSKSTVLNIVWVAVLTVALLLMQGTRLHIHAHAHGPAILDHAHQHQVHFAHETLEDPTHPDQLSQVDLSVQGVCKKLFNGSLLAAVLFAVITLLALDGGGNGPRPAGRRVPFTPRLSGLVPPLRAPPVWIPFI